MIRSIVAVVVLCTGSSIFAVPVQWSGNGHYYEQVSPPNGITWTDARAAAQARTFQGVPGHLATLTSAAEADFAYANITQTFTWIGLTDEVMEGHFKWVTGEPLVYTDWLANEPNNSADDPPGEDYVNIDFRDPAGGWNDYQDFSSISQGPPLTYLVEYEAVPEPAAVIGCCIIAPVLSRRRRRTWPASRCV